MGHFVQAFVGSKRMLDALQQRFGVSRVVELDQGLFMLPMLPELYDALPSSEDAAPLVGNFSFQFLDSRVITLLVQSSQEEAIAYFETDYFGGAGDQGALVAKEGKIVFGPVGGAESINSVLRLLGAKKRAAHDEFDAVGLGRFRDNEAWLNQPSHEPNPHEHVTSGSCDLTEEFYTAAITGDIAELRHLLTQEPSLIHSSNSQGFSALHGLAGEDQFTTVTFLLDQGANPNVKNDEGITPLHLAANPEMVELLVRRGAEIDSRSHDGSTPLIVQAAEAGSCEVMSALLRLGADPHATDKRGATALDIARSRNEADKVVLFEKQNVSPGKRWWNFWR